MVDNKLKMAWKDWSWSSVT